MIEIGENPAQRLTMRTTQTFQEFADHVSRVNARPISFDNGHPIELEKGKEYVFLLMTQERELTQSEFVALLPYMMGAIMQAETAGAIPAGVIKKIDTAFAVPELPEIPDEFADGEVENVKIYLDGHTTFRTTKAEETE